MADIRIDSRDLRLMLDALNGFMEDYDMDLSGAERVAYERLCDIAGVDIIDAFDGPQYKTQSLGFLEDEPPHRSGGIMSDYINRMGGFRRDHRPPPPPKKDVAKEIADKMARASSDAAQGKTNPNPTPAPAPKRALTDEEKKALREALGEE